MPKEKNIKIVLEYDGSPFHGWQFQINGITIQEVLEKKFSLVMNHPVKLIAAGRTDTGVHAKGQVINFLTTSHIPLKKLLKAVNSMVRPDIVLLSAERVPIKFNARNDAVNRWYQYRILNRVLPSVFDARYSYHFRHPLDLKNMRKAAKYLIGTHDFTAFNGSPELTANPVRTITKFSIARADDMVELNIHANGFFHHMVRTITGTLIDIGRGKRKYTEMKSILLSKDRKRAGYNVPAHGLFLMRVDYK